MNVITLDDEYSYPLHSSGSISVLPGTDDLDDVVRQLRDVVREITGIAVEDKPRQRIGFLP